MGIAIPITGKAKVIGVLGWPIAHSLSPQLHNYWLADYEIDGAYIPLAVRPESLADAVRALPKMGFCGANLTLPHKKQVLDLLAYVDEEARAIGAVNTIIMGNNGMNGMNTDGYGFIENVRPHLPERRNKAVVLGAGGASRAICAALKRRLGYTQVIVANRDVAKAHDLAELFQITPATWEARSQILDDSDLLVNTTSLGMKGKEALTIDLTALPKQALVTDIVYTPLMTPLLKQAHARGNPTVDGIGMLMHQAVPGFEAWFGIKPEVTPKLRKYLLMGLHDDDAGTT